MRVLKTVILLFVIACGSTKGPPKIPMTEWIGKTREEVQLAYSKLPPKTEENKITYRDTDPIPSRGRCAVIDCYPYTFPERISCTYVFKFKNDRVTSATRQGNCRDDKKN